MKTKLYTQEKDRERPRNKATMDRPQEEFIAPESAHADNDREHGSEVNDTSHRSIWENGSRVA